MRKYLLFGGAIMLAQLVYSQQKEGKVVYERTMQLLMQIADDHAPLSSLPKTRTDKFELNFANNQSIWKYIEEDENNGDFEGDGMRINIITPGQNTVFYDFSNARKVEQREVLDKTFIVEDSIRKLNWKLTGETQKISGFNCQKATAQNISKHMQMTMDNGNMQKKEVEDTSNIVAWFTPDIPVPAGPEVQGQLPGLILALDMNNGKMIYKVLEISQKADVASIKAPSKGKKLTPEEFTVVRNKMMDEMQKNNESSGPNRIIIRRD